MHEISTAGVEHIHCDVVVLVELHEDDDEADDDEYVAFASHEIMIMILGSN